MLHLPREAAGGDRSPQSEWWRGRAGQCVGLAPSTLGSSPDFAGVGLRSPSRRYAGEVGKGGEEWRKPKLSLFAWVYAPPTLGPWPT